MFKKLEFLIFADYLCKYITISNIHCYLVDKISKATSEINSYMHYNENANRTLQQKQPLL